MVNWRLIWFCDVRSRQHFSTELSSGKRVKLIFNAKVLEREAASLSQLGLDDNCVVHCLVIHRPAQTLATTSTDLAANRDGTNHANQGSDTTWPGLHQPSLRTWPQERFWCLCHVWRWCDNITNSANIFCHHPFYHLTIKSVRYFSSAYHLGCVNWCTSKADVMVGSAVLANGITWKWTIFKNESIQFRK